MNREMRSLHRWGEDLGWRGRVGFISPPTPDSGPMEFLRIAPEGFAVSQTMTYIPNFRVCSPDLQMILEQMESCAMALREAGVDIIAQTGVPLSFVHDERAAFAVKLKNRIERRTGRPMVMMGLALINALKNMGCSSVAVACTYVPGEMLEKYRLFLEEGGLSVLAIENWVSQGFFPSQKEVEGAGRRYTMSYTYRAARLVAAQAPKAECIVIGGGVNSMDVLEPLEKDLRKPVISSVAAQFWEIFVRLGIGESVKGRGSLLASLERGAKLDL